MKGKVVYVLLYEVEYEGGDLVDVFHSREAAMEAALRCAEDGWWGPDTKITAEDNGYGIDSLHWEVLEVEVK